MLPARINCVGTCTWTFGIQADVPCEIMVADGDDVRDGTDWRTNVLIFATLMGGVGIRIGAVRVARGPWMFATVVGTRDGTWYVVGVCGRVTVIEACVTVRAGSAVIWVRFDDGSGFKLIWCR